MGGWSNQIGHYEVSQMDYYYEDIKDEEQTLDYYNSKTVQVEFKNLKTKESKLIDVPLIELHDFIKYKDNDLYFLSSENEEKSLRNWLWNKLKKSNIKVTSAFKLNVHLSNRDNWKVCPDYFLNSKPLEDKITISTDRVEFEIESLEVLDWLGSRGFYYA
jgi:hypothetical protein